MYRKLKDKRKRDRGACLGSLNSGDKMLVRSLPERGSTGKKYQTGRKICILLWKQNMKKESLCHKVNKTTKKDQNTYRNSLLSFESLPEKSEGIQLKIDRAKQKERRKG